ncbi:fasciculation and elongation protein zeta-2 [Malaya genurostris]|uniref:fasciculation and elongation protein zeta-2 n=1 Tax=Malaya genurostris TaxID=325434 RepID=UPI0026F3D602|nr:fasciculation and elongation protein zeta-2 [Malaya genurostris]
MRDIAYKMAELKFEAPLAQCEETDEWGPVEYHSSTVLPKCTPKGSVNVIRLNGSALTKSCTHAEFDDVNDNDLNLFIKNCNGNIVLSNLNINKNNRKDHDNFAEAFTGSLEDLVNTFDEKITQCFGNFEQSVEELAPVQVRSQDDIMNECQMWWTITGNFGNILPIDWSKTYARQMHVPALKLAQSIDLSNYYGNQDLSSEDEAVASDLDMHSLILGGIHPDNDPIKTAEEVLKEIDDIMDESASEDGVLESEAMERTKEALGSPLYEEKLRSLSITQLNELYMEMEVLIREFSETLISELAFRDELEYEKELKNTFISLILSVQNRRRHFHVERKRGRLNGKQIMPFNSVSEPKYLTTVIPYNLEGTPDNHALQVLIKILKAINEDSPTVPTLLTDYILKVLCPT